jgi:hypothetical protein
MPDKRTAQAKRVEFFCSAETSAEAKRILRCALGASNSAAAEEKWLQAQKAEYIKKKVSEPEYWDGVKIFKVTIEEIPRNAR